MITKPRVPKPFWKRRTTYGFVVSLMLTGLGCLEGYVTFLQDTVDGKFHPWIKPVAVAVGGIWVLFDQISNVLADETEQQNLQLETLLRYAHKTVMSVAPTKAGTLLRICVHVRKGEKWVQATNYVGPKKRKGLGKKSNISKGIVGKAFRETESGSYSFFQIQEPTKRINELVSVFGYTKREAEDIRRDAVAWIAVPIGPPNDIYAVVFADVNELDFWGKSTSLRRKTLLNALSVIAELIDEE